MDDLIENALRIMVSLARLPTLEPTTVAELLGVRLHALRASPYRVDYGATGPFPFPTAQCELRWNVERSRGFLLVELAPGFRLPESRVTHALSEFPAVGRYSARTFPHGASAAELATWDPGRMDVYRAPGGSLRLAFERLGDADASGFSIDGLEQS
jgi:hypothetical protein